MIHRLRQNLSGLKFGHSGRRKETTNSGGNEVEKMRIAGVFPPQAALRSAAPPGAEGAGGGLCPVRLVE